MFITTRKAANINCNSVRAKSHMRAAAFQIEVEYRYSAFHCHWARSPMLCPICAKTAELRAQFLFCEIITSKARVGVAALCLWNRRQRLSPHWRLNSAVAGVDLRLWGKEELCPPRYFPNLGEIVGVLIRRRTLRRRSGTSVCARRICGRLSARGQTAAVRAPLRPSVEDHLLFLVLHLAEELLLELADLHLEPADPFLKAIAFGRHTLMKCKHQKILIFSVPIQRTFELANSSFLKYMESFFSVVCDWSFFKKIYVHSTKAISNKEQSWIG